MTRGTINNGRTVRARFGEFDGRAGLTERAGGTQIAFFGEFRKLRALAGGEGAIDGAPYRVNAVAPSEYVKGMVVLSVEPIETSEGEA